MPTDAPQTASDRTARVGVWLVGARGSVATTAVVGAAAIKAGLAGRTALVTELPEIARAGLVPWDGLVFGGHDVDSVPLTKRAELLAAAGVLPPELPRLVSADLQAADAQIRPGTTAAGDQRATAQALAADIDRFRRDHDLHRVVVVNVASTEPPRSPAPEHASRASLEAALDSGADVLPTSSLYAYAALSAGCPVVDFTPSTGPRLAALDELARDQGLPYAGSDGKTGETLVKSALAPLFATRALAVRSWVGTNILGGGDGANLADPLVAASKTTSKGRAIERLLGPGVEAPVHIDYVSDMGEWKTAWDHVSFEGFLGARMTMQFTWQGCDSALAAPLVLDLARLAARAQDAGRSGPLPELAFFFKDPVGADEHGLAEQWSTLVRWAAELGGPRG